MGDLPNLTAFDLTVIATVLVSAILALARGFVRELMTLLTWGGAALTAFWLWPPVRVIVQDAVDQSLVVDAITLVLVFLVPLIIYKLVASMLVRGVDESALSGIDRSLGLVFGVARGVLVVAVVYLVAIRLVPIEDHPAWVTKAWLLPQVQNAALVVDGLLPSEVTARGLDAIEKGAGTVQTWPILPGFWTDLPLRPGPASKGMALQHAPPWSGWSSSKRASELTIMPLHADRTTPYDDDKLHEECGCFGVWGHADGAAVTALGLHALQHRGQEAAGIVSLDRGRFYSHRAIGLVDDDFSKRSVIETLPGQAAVGHVRYSTTGASELRNVQPLYADYAFGGLAIAHNGNLTNAMALKKRLVNEGSLFQSTSDTEVLVHLIARSHRQEVVDRITDALFQIEGAWSLVALFADALIGVRDPLGIRPLVLGRLGTGWVLASETVALDIMGAELFGTWRRARSSSSTMTGRDRSTHFVNSRSAFAFLSTSTSPARIRSLRTAGFTRSASGSARNWRKKVRCWQTSWFLFRTAVSLQLSDLLRPAGYRSNSASSGTTMSAAPSSNLPIRSGIWASS